jgi:pimeloyl-ACP methyl ester carboxylesterase
MEDLMKRFLILLAPAAAAVALAAGAGGALAGSSKAATAPVHSDCVKKSDRATSLRYESSDGASLGGVSFGEGKVGVVFAHPKNQDLCSWLPLAREVARKGYRVMLFDFAYPFGASRASPSQAVDFGAEILASVEQVKKLGAERVVLLGGDVGGLFVHVAAASMEEPPLAVIDMVGPLAWNGKHVLAYLPKSPAPILYVASKGVGYFGQPPAVGRRILAAATQAKAKKLVVAENKGSGPSPTDYFRYPWGKPVKKAILAWIAKFGKVAAAARAPYIPADATTPREMTGAWERELDFSCDGSIEGGGTFRLRPEGYFEDHVPSDFGDNVYPGIWFLQGDTINIHYYYAGPSEGSPKGSLLTAKVTNLNTKSLSGDFTSPLGSGFGCWRASR